MNLALRLTTSRIVDVVRWVPPPQSDRVRSSSRPTADSIRCSRFANRESRYGTARCEGTRRTRVARGHRTPGSQVDVPRARPRFENQRVRSACRRSKADRHRPPEPRLRAKRVLHYVPDGPICRYRIGGELTELMPVAESVLGFTNRWDSSECRASLMGSPASGAGSGGSEPGLPRPCEDGRRFRRAAGDGSAVRRDATQARGPKRRAPPDARGATDGGEGRSGSGGAAPTRDHGIV